MVWSKARSAAHRKRIPPSSTKFAVTVFPVSFDKRVLCAFLQFMISLTDSAVKQIGLLQAEKAEKGQLLRVFVEPGGCSGFEYGMSFDEKKEGDSVLESNGVSFLIDATSLEYLDGSEVDFDDGLAGKGFDIRNPNASSTCGCGRSFN
jgi:iron-sulfur cluster assembly protein/iron-sulfur cluster insertion protein